jgi:hypothetical protein
MGLRKEHHRIGGNYDPITLDERAQYAATLWKAAKALDVA